MIQIGTFTFNAFGENTYVLHDETGEAIVIDPGCYEPQELAELDAYVLENGLKLMKIVNTHAHIDHVLGVDLVKRKYEIPFYLHKLDEPLLKAVRSYAPNYGFPRFSEPEIDGYLEGGDAVRFGNSELRIVFVPGHAPGHVAFICADQRFVIGGDVLFRQSIGRTDLPGGNMQILLRSIRTEFFTLPDDYVVYAGHMEPTTIGYEKEFNPFLR
jgi:hydroxyacylglutathione hydrolase